MVSASHQTRPHASAVRTRRGWLCAWRAPERGATGPIGLTWRDAQALSLRTSATRTITLPQWLSPPPRVTPPPHPPSLPRPPSLRANYRPLRGPFRGREGCVQSPYSCAGQMSISQRGVASSLTLTRPPCTTDGPHPQAPSRPLEFARPQDLLPQAAERAVSLTGWGAMGCDARRCHHQQRHSATESCDDSEVSLLPTQPPPHRVTDHPSL